MAEHQYAEFFRAIADAEDMSQWECRRFTWHDHIYEQALRYAAQIAMHPAVWTLRRKGTRKEDMNGHCNTCPVEKECGYPYKPTDCCNQRKFRPVVASEILKQTAKATDEEFGFVLHWIDGCGNGFRYMKSVSEIRGWARANSRVVGKAQLHVPTYEIHLGNGEPVSQEIMTRIQPENSEDLHAQWYRESLSFLGARTIPETSIPGLYDGAAQVAISQSGILSKQGKA